MKIPFASLTEEAIGTSRPSFHDPMDRIVVEIARVGAVLANSMRLTRLEFCDQCSGRRYEKYASERELHGSLRDRHVLSVSLREIGGFAVGIDGSNGISAAGVLHFVL